MKKNFLDFKKFENFRLSSFHQLTVGAGRSGFFPLISTDNVPSTDHEVVLSCSSDPSSCLCARGGHSGVCQSGVCQSDLFTSES